MDDSGLTLWHGERLLGRIHLRQARSDTFIAGVLLPASDAIHPQGLQQRRSDILPGRPVLQRRIAAERLWDGREEALDEDEPPPVSGRVFMIATFGVPVAEQLSIRDSSGQTLPLDGISLREVKLGSDIEPRFSWPVPREAVHRGSVWKISGTRVAAR